MPGFTLTGGFTLNNFSLNTVWTPANLFKDGSNGVWYDPSDLSTLFQDSTGATPVTAVEQSVGLMLDKSKGLVLGGELLGNPSFTSSANYILLAGATIFGGQLFIDNQPNSRAEGTGNFLPTNKTLLLEIDIASTTGSIAVVLADAAGSLTISARSFSVTGVSRVYVQSLNTNGNFRIIRESGATVVNSISFRELSGNHAYQTSLTARPVLSARVNLLTKTEEFNDAAWVKTNTTITANTPATTDPLGGNTADMVTLTGATTTKDVARIGLSFTTVSKFSIFVKAGTHDYMQILNNGDAGMYANVNMATGVVGNVGAQSSVTMTPIGNGWYQVFVTFTPGTFGSTIRMRAVDNNTAAYGASTASTGTFYIWGADLRVANDTPSLPYQRVNTSTDYETTGFPYYLRFDGSNDNMLTSNINFSTGTSDGQARRNLLNFPTIFNDTTWVKSTATIVPNVIESPNLTLTADKLIAAVGAGTSTTHNVTQSVTLTASTNYTYSAYLKQAELGFAILYVGSVGAGRYINLTNGTVGSTFVGAPLSTTITDVGNGWYRVSISFNSAGITSADVRIYAANADSTGSTFIGDGVSGIYIYGAQLETGLTATTFQNIGTAIMNVFTGVRKLSDTNSSGFGVITEFSANVDSNDGSFGLYAPRTNQIANSLQVTSKGATASVINYDNFTTPSTGVLTMQTNMSSDSLTLSFNNNVVGTSNSDQGIDNYGNYPLYLGSRNTSSAFYNGRLYGLVIAGRYLSFNETYLATRYMNNQTKAY